MTLPSPTTRMSAKGGTEYNDVSMSWLAIQKSIGSFVFNQDLHRPYSATLAKRREGFTEEWNYDDNDDDPDDNKNKNDKDNTDEHIWNPKEALDDAHMVGTGRQNVPLRLVQYRPAWLEQLVLRVARQPHQVCNSPYFATEFTGKLPMLQDFQSSSNTTAVAAMVGRYQPLEIPSHSSNNNNNNHAWNHENAILHYLKIHHHIDLDKHLNESQRDQSIIYMTLIRETLIPCAQALRYQEEYTWMQLYRPQCITASLTHGNTGDANHQRRWGRPFATFQAWNERIQNSYPNQPDVDTAIRRTRQTYQILERTLEEHRQRQPSKKLYLLGTESPTIVDCFLWDHIMQALTDVHLVVVLADFPRLIQFTQEIWDTYQFGMAIDDGNPYRSWTVWNFEQNALNAFNDVPLLPKRSRRWEIIEPDQQSVYTQYQDAIELMKRISIQPLQETLQAVKAVRERTMRLETQQKRPRKSGWTWYRWRMGDTFFPQPHSQGMSGGSATSSKPTSNEEKLIRDYRRNDEIWMASVAVTTAAAIIFGMGMSKEQQRKS
jgi:hypothetical protein